MNNLRAISLVVVSMATFATADLIFKVATEFVSSGMMIFCMGVIGAAFCVPATILSGQRLWTRDARHPAVLMRCLAEVFASTGIITALTLAPLSLVASISQATPLFVIIGAAFYLRERVGVSRWIAVLVGLGGIIVMLRPGDGVISAGALYAIVGALGLAARDLLVRKVPGSVSNIQLTTYGFLVLIPSGLALMTVVPAGPVPDARSLSIVAVATVCAGTAYYIMTAAMRLADASLLTPFRYTRLVFAMALAMIVLGERPDATTLLGAAVVIAAGLAAVWAERRRQSAAKHASRLPPTH